MTGLWWYRRRAEATGIFCRAYVANAIADIAGGRAEQYLNRAGRMIAKEQKRGTIEPAFSSGKRYWKFTTPNDLGEGRERGILREASLSTDGLAGKTVTTE